MLLINHVTFRHHMSAITSITYHQKKNWKSAEIAGNSDSRVYRLIRYRYTAYAETKFIQRLAQFSLVSVGGGTPRFQCLPAHTCLPSDLYSVMLSSVFARAPFLKTASNANELSKI